MAIEGLRTIKQPAEADISDHVGASVEVLDLLDLVEDRDQVTASVTSEYRGLGQSGRAGEAYIQLPRALITLDGMKDSLDAGKYPDNRQYPKTDVYRELWTPDFNAGGYKVEELDNLTLGGDGNFKAHARLAVHNPVSNREPLLHFLDKPFDKEYARKKEEQTQLEAVEEAIQAYEAEGHEGFAMTPLNAKAVAFIALVRRIKGEAMPLTWGVMRDATLPRKTFGGYSVVGDVRSGGGRLYLYRSGGGARSGGGVGLSVGPKELKS